MFMEEAAMQRKCLADASCPVARSLDVVGDWWSLLILRDALRGARRFSEFERSLGIAKNILTVRLRKLEEGGIFAVLPASDGSAYQEYVLTPKGKALRPVITALWNWGSEYLFSAKNRPTHIKPLTFAR
jgi:DNA-binding HxlR family transcriptional regulator